MVGCLEHSGHLCAKASSKWAAAESRNKVLAAKSSGRKGRPARTRIRRITDRPKLAHAVMTE